MEFRDLLPVGVAIIVLGLVISFGLQVVTDIRADTTDSDAEAVLNDTVSGVGILTSKLPIIVTVLVAAVIIGVLLKAFVFR